MLIEVAFKGNRKEFFLWNEEAPLPVRAPVIVEADRGDDLGYVYAVGELAEKRLAGVAHAPEEPVTQVVRRRATAEEVKRVEELRSQDDAARRQAAERVRAAGLQMKVSDAEWRFDRRKLTFYFTAEKRVDFRTLVRELAALFKTRIELKQIGVRDEAKRLSGIGRCGREYCSASWLPDLRPVNLGVARDQRLSLNPTQISGACGRLMCCLRYEHEFYVQQRKRFPKEGKILETSKGEEKVLFNDIFRERVTLRSADGEVRIVPLAEFRREWKHAPAGEKGGMEDETPQLPVEGLSDEVLRLQDTAEMPAWLPRTEARGAGRPGRELPVREPRTRGSGGDTRPGAARAGQGGPGGERPARPARPPRPPRPKEEPPAATSAAPAADGAAPAPDDAEAQAVRGRRRRGRRGGRRNDKRRDNGSPPSSPPADG